MNSSCSIHWLTKKDIDEFFDVFSRLVQNQFPEYSASVRTHFYTGEREITKRQLFKKVKKNDLIFFAKNSKRIVGVLIADRPLGGISFCHWLAVDIPFQKKRIGQALLSMWEKAAYEVGSHGLHLESPKRNVTYYKKRGFELLGLHRKGYFGTDNYIFTKLLQEPNEKTFFT